MITMKSVPYREEFMIVGDDPFYKGSKRQSGKARPNHITCLVVTHQGTAEWEMDAQAVIGQQFCRRLHPVVDADYRE